MTTASRHILPVSKLFWQVSMEKKLRILALTLATFAALC